MSHKTIRSLYEGRLAAWAASRSPALTVGYQNKKFTPPTDGSAYLKCALLPAITGSEDLEGIHRIFQGIFQISIVDSKENGLGASEGIVKELSALFPNNLLLSKSGLTVYVRTPCTEGPAVQEAAKATIPVWFNYRADVI